jgi:amidase
MTIKEMQRLLAQNEVTSVDLVTMAIQTNEVYKDKNAIGVLSPVALKIATLRDEERKKGFIRGPLHGIPIVIKDNINYNDGTPTTANSFSFSKFFPSKNAPIIDSLLNAGAVIIGKANLSEFAYFMGDEKMPSGYGSMYGQVKHPFDERIDPYGSSTGSAVAVSLGIVPGSIGSETNGSLMAPAYQCQIVSIKPTFGFVSKTGIIPISPTQDTAGPMASTVYDCAVILEAIAFEDTLDVTTRLLPRPTSFVEHIDVPLNAKRIGIIKLRQHNYDLDDTIVINKAKVILESLGHECVDVWIDLPEMDNYPTLRQEFKYSLNQFLDEHLGQGGPASLSDIIEFNQKHSERCLKYGQATLLASESTNGSLDDPTYIAQRKKLIEQSSLLELEMIQQSLDCVFSPMWLGFAPIYGNPSICIPEGVFRGVPKANVFVGKKYDDAFLIRLVHQYEKAK